MPELRKITATHVEQALAEHDRVGREAFLEQYGFRPSRTYVLRHAGREYDSKAVVGVAHRYATGRAARSAEFNGGLTGAVRVLTELGFEVVPGPRPDDAVVVLGDGARAVRPADLADLPAEQLDGPGLYSWFVDRGGAVELSRGLGHEVAAGLVYVGQAGATRWPSGTASGSTLRKRLSAQHVRGRRSVSTFRRTLGAVLDLARGTPITRPELTVWIHEHLAVVPMVVEDAETLGELEEQVVRQLQPPLNLDHAGPSDVRARLRELRAGAAKLD